mgnify:CR=1 FL=1
MDIKELIRYVNGLEKAYKLINDGVILELDEDIKNKLNNVSAELGFIIEDIDTVYYEEFFGEEE